MNNSVFKNLRKALLNMSSLKKVLDNKKQIDHMIKQIDSFQDLCQPSIHKVRTCVDFYEIHHNNCMAFNNSMKIDFIYVVKGLLRVTLIQIMSSIDEVMEYEIYLKQGDFIDFITQFYGFKDTIVKEIICLNP